MACACKHHGHTDEPSRPRSGVHATSRWWIDLAAGESRSRVDLTRLAVVRVLGLDVVPLEDVWAAGHLGIPASALEFDFVGGDGFHLAREDRPFVDGRDLPTGYVCVPTRDLLWRPVPERPCFWRVKGVVRVVGRRRVTHV